MKISPHKTWTENQNTRFALNKFSHQIVTFMRQYSKARQAIIENIKWRNKDAVFVQQNLEKVHILDHNICLSLRTFYLVCV